MVIHDDGHTNIENNDALGEFSAFRPRRDIRPGKYTLLLTNPPFGAAVKNEETLARFALGSKDAPKRKRQKTEVLFMERCLELIQPGGRIGIVLPDGILANKTMGYVRRFVDENARLLAVISLPASAFVPADSGVKASLLFLERRQPGQSIAPNYPIFMALADHVGYDATGRPDKNELPEIVADFQAFGGGKKKFSRAFLLGHNELRDRMDAYFYQPKFRQIESELSKAATPLKPLKDLVIRIAGGATPTAKGSAYTDMSSGIPFLRIQNISPNELLLADLNYVIPEVHNGLLKRSKLKAGDVLMTITGRIGTAAVVPPDLGEANINQHIVKMEVKPGVDPYYVAAFLNSKYGQGQALRLVTGTTRIALDYDAILSIRIPTPPVDVQRRVAERLREAQERAEELRQRASAIELEAVQGLECEIMKTRGRARRPTASAASTSCPKG
jgi:type I restriction enzyme M protein